MKNKIKINTIQTLKLLNALYFIILLGIAIYFGKQRVLLLDGADSIKIILNDHLIPIMDNRYPPAINHIFTYLFFKLGFCVKSLILVSSLNYLLLPLCVYAVLKFKQKSIKYETSFLFGLTIFNSTTYFYPIHDYWFGFYMFFILYRLLDEDTIFSKKYIQTLLSVFIIFLILISHLNISFGILLLILYLKSNKRIKTIDFIIFLSAVIFTILIKLKLFTTTYEYEALNINFIKLANIDFIRTNTINGFFFQLVHVNLNYTLFILIIMFYAISKRHYNVLIITFSELIIGIVLINILFPEYGYVVYTEGYFKSMNLVIPIILVNFVEEFKFNNKKAFIAFVFVNYSFCIFNLMNASKIFVKRYELIKETGSKLTQNTIFTSQQDICPYVFTVMPIESKIINMIENNSEFYFSAIIRNSPESLYYLKRLEKEYSTNKSILKFDGNYTYKDADSLNIDLKLINFNQARYNCLEFLRIAKYN